MLGTAHVCLLSFGNQAHVKYPPQTISATSPFLTKMYYFFASACKAKHYSGTLRLFILTAFLQIIPQEPLNVETLFKHCHIGLKHYSILR